ncbi:topoisomerase-like DNA binding C4 zinc finger protein [Desulfosoma caldarium]|uniref:Topoisomerase-like DNA binding C4 zinc finger protein n=2 Tax=Desulfosoma caldarium TaxID=610254 RepID=A0A3N1UI19_9BACT|nr:topoisomerase-like DNA binding C4 zinc finger protein [Desulfosoma caldarium]
MLMIKALGLEIAAIRKKTGKTQIELRAGERVGAAGPNWIYRFVVHEDLNLRDDTPIRVTVGQEDVAGLLLSFRDGVLLVALEKDLGPRIAAARLVADDSFLLERLKERLEKVQNGEVSFNRSAADRVLGLKAASTADADPHPLVYSDGAANADQISAVRRSLGSDMTFVWGPPGTGKTSTLARIVEAHYRAGRSVLLVSNTNIAVDTAMERVVERLLGEPQFHQGLVIRKGPVVKPELRQRFGPQVIFDDIVARLSEKLQRDKDDLLREVAPLESEERSLVAALKIYEQLASTREELAANQKMLAATEENIARHEQEAEQHRIRAARARSDLERAQGMGPVRRFFLRLDPKRLAREAAEADQAAQAAFEAARALASDLTRLRAEIARLRKEVDQLVAQTQPYPPPDLIKTRLDKLGILIGQIRKRIEAIDSELAAIEQQVLARCKILGTTVYRTYLDKALQRQFDTVVIDEASMLMPPLVYYAAGLATQSVTVAGDFRQLPPIVMSDEQLTDEWLKRDVFEKAGIPKRLAQRKPTPHLIALGIQYRMCERICTLVNDLFYADHPLRSHPSANRCNGYFPLSEASLLYVDTAPFHPWAALRVGTYSRYNLFHALLVRNIIVHLAETGFLPPAGEPNDAVGVIAPYASQVRLIQSLLNERLGDRAAGVVATVHRYQGNEKAAVVLDLTDSYGTHLSHFLKATRMEQVGARLLNVAVSRARQHLILLGNFQYLRAHAPRDGFVRRLLDHFEHFGEALNVNALLPLAERDWIDGLHLAARATFDLPEEGAGVFNESTFYPAFLMDLARVRESIVIFSPFATPNGTARWADPLRVALARGVKARIVTRPPTEFGGGSSNEVVELVQSLRRLGVKVDLRARMHEKLAILDGRILWHGSLNILSHRDTHESMLRFESPAVCQQLTRLLATPARWGDEDAEVSLHAHENPACPLCGGPTVFKEGRYGIYFTCEDTTCEGKMDMRRGRSQRRSGHGRENEGSKGRGRRQDGARTDTGRKCPTPGCTGRLVERDGRFGRFLGCTNYPRCRYTQNVE